MARRFQHYKGGYYEMIGIAEPIGDEDYPTNLFIYAQHTETGKTIPISVTDLNSNNMRVKGTERLVIYFSLDYHLQPRWARPYDMFFENIEYEGEIVPRFKEI
jgi:hypothetical protein